MPFPQERPRRLRMSAGLRRLSRETRLSVDNLILPLFVVPGEGVRNEIASMPGNYHLSIDQLLEVCREASELNLPGVMLFGVPDAHDRDATGSAARLANSLVAQAVSAVKAACPDLLVMTDVCICAYTTSGHCGVVKGEEIVNDLTLPLLAEMALVHARAGADVVAPSDMMDGRVEAIRGLLDTNGFHNTVILSYAVKYASAYYGPFRDAAESAPAFGDRRSHQMDPANRREALREVRLDLAEGADMVMVKPALAYLDIISDVREATDVPVAAYHVSGEFSMIKAAAEKGWIDERAVVLETLTGMVRAGADIILTYHALDVARWINA
ncbi:MAG: porphobilinogen synthase [Planctomycetota bacterium]|jgi:porphobilinogen synthase